MSEDSSSALSADELADKRIIRQLAICIGVMMVIAVVIGTAANSIA